RSTMTFAMSVRTAKLLAYCEFNAVGNKVHVTQDTWLFAAVHAPCSPRQVSFRAGSFNLRQCQSCAWPPIHKISEKIRLRSRSLLPGHYGRHNVCQDPLTLRVISSSAL